MTLVIGKPLYTPLLITNVGDCFSTSLLTEGVGSSKSVSFAGACSRRIYAHWAFFLVRKLQFFKYEILLGFLELTS